MTLTKKVSNLLNVNSKKIMTKEEIIKENIDEFLQSTKRKNMILGQKYYENHNYIVNKKRNVIGENGAEFEDPRLSNTKLSHSFLRKITDQKIQYLFGKPIAVNTENKVYSDILENFFNRSFQRDLKNLAKESVNKGIAFLQLYFLDGKLKFQKIPSQEIIPVWQDAHHTTLESVIRIYDEIVFNGKKKELVRKIKWYTTDGIENFIYSDNKVEVDSECPFETHFTVDGQGFNFEKIPFVYFKYNEEEIPLIHYVKPLIDDYDLLTSEDSDNILDQPNSLMVLTNYDGQNLGEFRQNLSRYKAVKVSDGGGIDIKSANINTENINQHLALTRRDIYELGRGVDTQSDKVGKATGVALKFLYADLDLDCGGIETEFQSSFTYLLYFINTYISMTSGKSFKDEWVEFIFNRHMIINESEAIIDCKNSVGLIDEDTIKANHPWVGYLGNESKNQSL